MSYSGPIERISNRTEVRLIVEFYRYLILSGIQMLGASHPECAWGIVNPESLIAPLLYDKPLEKIVQLRFSGGSHALASAAIRGNNIHCTRSSVITYSVQRFAWIRGYVFSVSGERRWRGVEMIDIGKCIQRNRPGASSAASLCR